MGYFRDDNDDNGYCLQSTDSELGTTYISSISTVL